MSIAQPAGEKTPDMSANLRAAIDEVSRWSAHVERFSYVREGEDMDASPHMLAAAARRLITFAQQPEASTPERDVPAGHAEAYVAGPVWRDAEQEDECWNAEVQFVGGYFIAATVHGGDRAAALERQAAVLAALNASPAPNDMQSVERLRKADIAFAESFRINWLDGSASAATVLLAYLVSREGPAA